MVIPHRVQRKRTRGFKLPSNTVSVTRGTKFGNPFKVGESLKMVQDQIISYSDLTEAEIWDDVITQEIAVRLFKTYLHWTYTGRIIYEEAKDLKGKNLACYCSLDKPCHADILLEIANEY